jgi:hypothetical protein
MHNSDELEYVTDSDSDGLEYVSDHEPGTLLNHHRLVILNLNLKEILLTFNFDLVH